MWIFHINLIFLCPSQTKSHAFRPGDLEGHNPRLVNRSTRTPYKSAIEMLAFWSVEMCFMKYRTFIRPFRKIAKIDYQLRHVCSSVLPFAWNISVLTGRVFMESDIWVFFSKICLEISSLIAVWLEKRVPYMETDVLPWYYLAQLFLYLYVLLYLYLETFRTKVIEKIKPQFMFSIFFFFRKSCRFLDNVEKCGRSRQATDENAVRRMRFACQRKQKYGHALRTCNTYSFIATWICGFEKDGDALILGTLQGYIN